MDCSAQFLRAISRNFKETALPKKNKPAPIDRGGFSIATKSCLPSLPAQHDSNLQLNGKIRIIILWIAALNIVEESDITRV